MLDFAPVEEKLRRGENDRPDQRATRRWPVKTVYKINFLKISTVKRN